MHISMPSYMFFRSPLALPPSRTHTCTHSPPPACPPTARLPSCMPMHCCTTTHPHVLPPSRMLAFIPTRTPTCPTSSLTPTDARMHVLHQASTHAHANDPILSSQHA